MNASGRSAISLTSNRGRTIREYLHTFAIEPRGGTRAVAIAATLASLAAFWWFYTRGETLLYGDAVAHLHIARRVFDSQTPGFRQLGTVWLPLPHLLMLPFLLSDWLWRTGIGGAIPSMVAFVFGAVGIFRLVHDGAEGTIALVSPLRAGWLAALVYMANPNLLYLQTTAMTEPLYLTLMIWAVVFFADFVRSIRRGLPAFAADAVRRCAWCLMGCAATRYDGWFLTACMVPLVLLIGQRGWNVNVLRRALKQFVLIAAAFPALWMAYNLVVFQNPLEFATGQYSARAIAERTTPPGAPRHPGASHLGVAGLHFMKAANLNVGVERLEKAIPLMAVAGAIFAVLLFHSLRPAMLLWMPLPFYALSIAYGSVPIFVPEWWPFSYYNVRYGLQLLPAYATFTAAGFVFLAGKLPITGRRAILAILLAAVAGSYGLAWRSVPISLREARVNSAKKMEFERQLAAELAKLPPNAVILMHTGSHPYALQAAGIPFKRTINEGNWKLWQAALAAPGEHVQYLVTFGTDEVARSVAENQDALQPAGEVVVDGYRAALYRTKQ